MLTLAVMWTHPKGFMLCKQSCSQRPHVEGSSSAAPRTGERGGQLPPAGAGVGRGC